MIGLSPQQSEDHVRRVHRELIAAGATAYGLLKSESRFLPRLIHKDEHILAVIYGQRHSNSAMMVATDRRILYVDKKPMAVFLDEVTYDVVSGIEFDIHTFFATVTLFSAKANYTFKFVNLHCAEKFVKLIERQRVRKEKVIEEDEPEPTVMHSVVAPHEWPEGQTLAPSEKHLAGYYLNPGEGVETEEEKEEDEVFVL